MVSTPRDRARERTMRDIVVIGREQLATVGPAALSLRAVARELGVVSSAIYRYVQSRDELITLLVIDAYDELGDTVDEAIDSAGDRPRDWFLALGHAVRSWALANPARYGLLFGTPVPGYQAPGERTTDAGTRVARALVAILEAAHRAGTLASVEPGAAEPAFTDRTRADLAAIRRDLAVTLDDAHLARGMLAWTSLFGLVTFEVFGQYGADTFAAPDDFFGAQLDALATLACLTDR